MKVYFLLFSLLVSFTGFAQAQPPIMGWSSWNHFHINIDEEMVKQQADIMRSSRLYDAGYRFINIDDGYFEGLCQL